ncbi:MAG TPA: low molecular weight protein-tyrosine-phosphatase [Longimicrobiales bacterium]|nr:low molecular weight protein-tyrosine-phosphatase [Longimicrobiales bacterium]
MSERIGVLFVCLGNICRSPLAEGVFRGLVAEEGLEDRFDIDSAGTSSYHAGDPPDPRTVSVAAQRGVRLEHAARQLTEDDLARYHYVLAMDASNLGRIERLAAGAPAVQADIRLLREFDDGADGELEVPDPYFGGAGGFEDVHDMVERACRGLLRHIREADGP